MPRRRTTARPITRAQDEGITDESPLFADASELAFISVSRDEPEEGYVGRITPASTERDILRKFGGGTFTLSPKGSGGTYVKGLGQRMINIAGDPIFQSKAAELKWKRQQGLDEKPAAAAPAAAAADKPISIVELMMLMDRQGERARLMYQEQADQRQREAEAAHKRQLELVREDGKRRELELEAERARLAQDAADRQARQDRELAAEQERQRQHMALMVQLVKAKSEVAADSTPLSSLMAGIKLATELRGDGDGGDPLSALAHNLPEVIAQARQLVSAEKQQPGAAGADQGVHLEGPVGDKARRLVEQLQKAGKDPAVELGRMFDVISRHQPGAVPTAPQPQPATRRPRAAPAPAPARARAAARRPTPPAPKSRPNRKSATR